MGPRIRLVRVLQTSNPQPGGDDSTTSSIHREGSRPDRSAVSSLCLLMQDVLALNLDWEDSLPDAIKAKWQAWARDLKALANLKIPRCIRRPAKPSAMQLHAFSDASENGFGVGVYLRSEYGPGDNIVRLIVGKKSCISITSAINSASRTTRRSAGNSSNGEGSERS